MIPGSDEHGIVTLSSGKRFGEVLQSSISQIKPNPRAMSPAEYEALKQSIKTHGFCSAVAVDELAPGMYGIVDGHHRVKAMRELFPNSRIPVILLDGDPAMVSLAMLTFNITGSPSENYMDHIQALIAQHGSESVSAHLGLEKTILDDMTKVIDDILLQHNSGEESGAMGGHFGGTAFVGRPIRIEITNTEETRQLLAKAREVSKTMTDGAAVLVALKNLVAGKEITPDVDAT